VVCVQVNKPYLPLASGEYSLATGIAIVVTFAAVVCMSTLCMLFTLPAQQDLISDILLLGCKSPICHANLLNRGLLAVCSGTFSTLSLHQESQSKFSCLNGEV
jgi:hypothetical protein